MGDHPCGNLSGTVRQIQEWVRQSVAGLEVALLVTCEQSYPERRRGLEHAAHHVLKAREEFLAAQASGRFQGGLCHNSLCPFHGQARPRDRALVKQQLAINLDEVEQTLVDAVAAGPRAVANEFENLLQALADAAMWADFVGATALGQTSRSVN